MPVAELPELSISSKTQSPEKINEVLSDLGYNVTDVQTEATQETPEEVAAAEAAQKATEEAATVQAAEEATQKEEKERVSRNERRRLARERDQQAIKDATARGDSLAAELKELREAQAKTNSDIEEIRKNPPKAEVEPPLPEAPKRPTRADFFEAEDPETAYEDAVYDYRKAKEQHNQLVEDRKKPKEPVVKEVPKAEPVPAAKTTENVDPATIKDPVMKRFYTSVEAVTKAHPDAGVGKALTDNIPNLSEPMISALHVFDEPARIALYLAKHPEESKRIQQLTLGTVAEDPRKVRIAQKEFEKLEQLAAEEDAAATAVDGSGDDDATDDEPGDNPEVDPSAARISKQPAGPGSSVPKQKAEQPPAAVAKPPKKKADPIEPVGARGAQTTKSYEQMTPAEQRALSVDEVRKLRGML